MIFHNRNTLPIEEIVSRMGQGFACLVETEIGQKLGARSPLYLAPGAVGRVVRAIPIDGDGDASHKIVVEWSSGRYITYKDHPGNKRVPSSDYLRVVGYVPIKVNVQMELDFGQTDQQAILDEAA